MSAGNGTGGVGGLATVVVAVADAAVEALRHTPEQLPELARAGVVDAGGLGLVIIFEALAEVVADRVPTANLAGSGAGVRPVSVVRETGSEEYGYEVQYLLDAPAARVAPLRADLAGLGDSLVIVGADAPVSDGATTVWNVHVHVNDVGAAIEAGIRAGRPHRISVTHFADGSGGPAPAPPPAPAAVAVSGAAAGVPDGSVAVVVAHGCPGLADLLAAEGVAVWADAEAPTSAEIVAAIRATDRRWVVLLPNGAGAHA
ncbi:DAK2 domain-containing protein, partial [Luedemannella flava]|uniref:DAK2 domain-containing protein n=1 Tax=Luedemannella flava TaxID=349316 RepID=UPI0031D478CA